MAILHPEGMDADSLVAGGHPPVGGLRPHGAALVVDPDADAWRSKEIVDRIVEEVRFTVDVARMCCLFIPRNLRWMVRRRLESLDASNVAAFAYLPNAARPSFILPLSPPPLSYALAQAGGIPPWLRSIAVHAVGLPVVRRALEGAMRDVVLVVTPRGIRPGAWLDTFVSEEEQGREVAVRPGWRGGDTSTLLFGLDAKNGAPTSVAKVPTGPMSEVACRHEWHNLEHIAPVASEAGVRVPRIMGTQKIGGRTAIVQSAVTGIPAATALAWGRGNAEELLTRLSRWLIRWNQMTLCKRVPGEKDLERWIGAPLQALPMDVRESITMALPGTSYQPLPLVDAHRDLTMRNLILEDGRPLGVVDWEEAASGELPLGDFFYAAVDLIMVADRIPRIEAFMACFEDDGRRTRLIQMLLQRMTSSLGLSRSEVQLCFDACWLGHASNEARRTAASDDQPFCDILRWRIENRDRLSLLRQLR